jgi:hypothetical protein
MKQTWKSAQEYTDSVEIRAVIDQEFHHLDVAVEGSHMQGSSVVVGYGHDMD